MHTVDMLPIVFVGGIFLYIAYKMLLSSSLHVVPCEDSWIVVKLSKTKPEAVVVQAISSSRVAGAPSMLEATNLSVVRSGSLFSKM